MTRRELEQCGPHESFLLLSLVIMGCFGRRLPEQDDVQLPNQDRLSRDPLALTGWVDFRQHGEWSRRWALITGCGILVVYTETNLGKTYKLLNLKDLKMRKTAKGVEMKLVTCASRKVKLRIKGEEARHWAARIFQPKGKKLGHLSHTGHLPPKASGSGSESDECSSDQKSQGSRFSYSLPLSSSEESIPRLLKERSAAGKVHSILTNTSMSVSEKKEKLSSLAGSTREQRAKSTENLDDDWPAATCVNHVSEKKEPATKQLF